MSKDPLRFALEVNPWTPVDDLREFTLMRGVIVGAWANVETMFKYVAFSCSKIDSYSSINDRIPTKTKELKAYFDKILSIDGPLIELKNDILILFEQFDDHSSYRHMLAHAHMDVLPNWGAVFKSYVPKRDKVNGDYYAYEEKIVTLDQMDEMTCAASKLSHEAQAIKEKILAILA